MPMMSAALPPRGGGPIVRVEYFTDPLCCWSWGLEPVWQRLRQHYGDRLERTVVLGGLIGSWTTFRDPMQDVGSPAQCAPLWYWAGRTTGVPIDPGLWHVDPPASSYPASVAVKAAAQQGVHVGERYLAMAREAAMTRRLNIARAEVLTQLAAELAIACPGAFDAGRFVEDLTGPAALDLFRADLQRTRYLQIGRFPTMIAHGPDGSRLAVGYRPLDAMIRFIDAAAGFGAPAESRSTAAARAHS